MFSLESSHHIFLPCTVANHKLDVDTNRPHESKYFRMSFFFFDSSPDQIGFAVWIGCRLSPESIYCRSIAHGWRRWRQ